MQHFYILSLKIAGIKNIEKPIEIKFYKESILNDFQPDQYKIKAIYGENGSGKTAIITAIKILREIVSNKTYLTDTLTQKNLVENINKRTKSGFIQIEYILGFPQKPIIDQYYLGFEVREDNRFYITDERMNSKNGNYNQNQYKTIFETKNGSLVDFGTKEAMQLFKERTQNLLDQRSLVSFITDIKRDDLTDKHFMPLAHMVLLHFLFFSINIFIDEADDHRRYTYQKFTNEAVEEMFDNSNNLLSYKDLLRHNAILYYADDKRIILKEKFDEYKNNISRMCAFIQIFKPNLQDIIIDAKEKEDVYQCNLIMKYKDYSIDSEYESRGIRKLMDLFFVLDQACDGNIAFIDELDASISDVYLGKLLEYFAYYGKGQLCFTAHNLSPMKFLRKRKSAISFISSINTIHTWASNGNRSPENAYRDGFIEDSPFNVESSDFLGILGGSDE